MSSSAASKKNASFVAHMSQLFLIRRIRRVQPLKVRIWERWSHMDVVDSFSPLLLIWKTLTLLTDDVGLSRVSEGRGAHPGLSSGEGGGEIGRWGFNIDMMD